VQKIAARLITRTRDKAQRVARPAHMRLCFFIHLQTGYATATDREWPLKTSAAHSVFWPYVHPLTHVNEQQDLSGYLTKVHEIFINVEESLYMLAQ